MAVAATARHFAHTFRSVRHGVMRGRRNESELPGTSTDTVRGALPAMSMQPPGFLRGLLAVTRFEVRLLLVHPGIYLFVPFIVLQSVGTASWPKGRLIRRCC